MSKKVSASSIIFHLRKNGKLSVADLLKAIFNERKFRNVSKVAMFNETLIDLLNAKFIEIVGEATSDGNEVNKFLKSPKFKNSQKAKLVDGYEFMSKMNPESTFLKVTDYFFRVQEIIGFSISDIFYRGEPIWGEVDDDLKTQVFVIMPFSKDLRPIYDDHILKVCRKIGYSCLRVDDSLATRQIMNNIWSYIYNADVIICDCTGCNPNVFYELGIAHGIGKNVICITQNKNDIPFDIQSIQYLKYEYTPRAMTKFEEKLEQYLAFAMKDAKVD